jgi:hypothetical protein
LYDAFSTKGEDQLDIEEFRNLVSFIFIINESAIHEFEIQSDQHLTDLMNNYHETLAKEKTELLSAYFPNKPILTLDDFLNTLMTNPIPNNWENLTYFKELCIDSYSNPKIFNYIAKKFNQVLNTTIPLLPEPPTPSLNPTNTYISSIPFIPSTPLELYNNNPPITIQATQMAYDVIEGDVNILDFIKEDKNNCAFYFSNNWYLFYKDQLEPMIDISKPGNEVVFKCNQVTGVIGPENVDKTKAYLRLRKLGLPLDDFVPLGIIKSIIEIDKQYFIIEKTNEKLDSVAGANIAIHQDDWLGAAHCQEGQGGTVSIIKILDPEIQQGGRKIKKKNLKTRTKKTKTKKNKNKKNKNKKNNKTKKIRKQKKTKTRKSKLT